MTDAQDAADLLTFASRAARLNDGTVRLRAERGVLVATTAVLAPRGLLDATPTVLGIRIGAVDPELVCDVVVAAGELSAASDDASAVTLPAVAVTAAWAGVAPPRSGWTEDGELRASTLAARAQWGIAAVADAVPRDAGEDAVRAVRAQIWGAPDEALRSLPLGVAFGAFALGFIGGEESAVVRTAGPWTRVSLARGHVLVRGAVRTGLTPVRPTGRSGV